MSAIIQSNKDFEVFFRENFPPVYAFMKRYTGDDELAADLAQMCIRDREVDRFF